MTDQPEQLNEYSYTDDNGTEVTLRLTQQEAEAQGLTKKGSTAASNKSRTAPNK